MRSPAAPAPKQNQGQPVPRIDARVKVTGAAHYAADVSLADMAHAVLVTSSIAKGTVVKIDTERARSMPGVLEVLSYGDVGALEPPKFGNSGASSLGPLHEKLIWHDGQIVAVVIAETLEAAQEAAFNVHVEYRSTAPSASLRSAGTETLPARGKAQMISEDPEKGDFATAFASAGVQLDAEYSMPTQHHNPIELFSTTAKWNDGKLTIYEPTQNVYGYRAEIARQLRMKPDDVRVVSEYVGGGFGSKGPMSARTALIALAAQRVKRPVRCVVTRMQGFTTMTYRAPTRHHIKMGADRNGKITAFSHEAWELTSRNDDYGVGGTATTTRMYGYPNVASRVYLVRADRQTPGYMRSPPETPYVYALETAIDEMAEQLGMDPVEFRRVNETLIEPIHGKEFSSRSVTQCFEQAARAFRWSKRNPRPGSMREGDWLIGYGCALAVYPTHVGAAAARVRWYADGRVLVQCASHEIGTGVRTIAAQVAAEELGVPYENVSVEMGDTTLPPAPVAGGSNSTATVCSTVIKACRQLSARRKESNAAVLEEYAEFIPDGAPTDAVQQLYAGKSTLLGGPEGKKAMYAFGAEFVEVRIHARTREIRVPRMVGAFAAGRIMNTRTARSQLLGGMIWGMSSALLEETIVDERNARYVNRDLAEYLVPVNADIGEVEVILVPEIDSDVNPAGAKGLGELGNVGTAAGVSNAVYHATGKRVRDLPIRLDKLLVLES